MEEIVNSWNVQLEQDATTFTNEAVKVRQPARPDTDRTGIRPTQPYTFSTLTLSLVSTPALSLVLFQTAIAY